MRPAGSSSAFLLGLLALAEASKHGYNHPRLSQDSDIVASAFSDVDVELLSPAFLEGVQRQPGFALGTQGPTSHETMETFLKRLADRNDYMTFKLANFTSEEGRTFPYVHLSSSNSSSQTGQDGSKVRIWVQGAVHGYEPAGDEAAQALLGKFDAEPQWAESVLEKAELLILPRYNPDGVYYFQRSLASNYDANRDHNKLARQQTRDIKGLFNAFNPHVVVDAHECGSSKFGGKRFKYAADGLFSAGKNLNIHWSIRNISETLFVRNIADGLDAAGLRGEPYVTGLSSDNPEYVASFFEATTSAKVGSNNMALSQAIVFLLEMRGIGFADQNFQRRVASGLVMMTSIIQTVVDNAQEVWETVERGIQDFIKSDQDIVVTDYTEKSIRPFTMVNVNTGEIEYPPVLFASTTPAFAELTRTRPEAYLIPQAWAEVAERMRVQGLEVETLTDRFNGTVEVLTASSVNVADEYIDDVIRVKITTKAEIRDIEMAPGGFLVSTRQKNAALAFVSLEPENDASYVRFNIIPMEVGDEYPIFRVLSRT